MPAWVLARRSVGTEPHNGIGPTWEIFTSGSIDRGALGEQDEFMPRPVEALVEA